MNTIWYVNVTRFGGKDSASVTHSGAFDDYYKMLAAVAHELGLDRDPECNEDVRGAVARFFRMSPVDLDPETGWLHSGAKTGHQRHTHQMTITGLPLNNLSKETIG